tara:strand:+ start:1315 stop:1602 length:288 start_codon:yes stop_codon:yes gene_type:complete
MIELTKVNNENWSKQSTDLRWVERREDGSVAGTHISNPKIGYTLAIDPYGNQFQTEPITHILESTDKIVHFKTSKEEYKLYLTKYFQEIYEKLKD